MILEREVVIYIATRENLFLMILIAISMVLAIF